MAADKNHNHRTPTTADDLDWVDITVDINDGWADDVSLAYPDDSWKPDEGELTMLSMPSAKEKEAEEKPAKKLKKKKSASPKSETASSSSCIKKSKIPPFRLFMIIWLGVLCIAIAIGLDYFYNFTVDYEKVYQESRPYHKMDDIVSTFKSHNMDDIYRLIDMEPVLSEFETDENVKHYIETLIDGAEFGYVETPDYLDDLPEYYLTANDYILAAVSLRKEPTNYRSYGFPNWYISSFDFYTEAQHSCRIQAAENCTVYINQIPVSQDYIYQRAIRLDENEYVKDYAALPSYVRYECDGLYEEPVITAVNAFGEPAPVTLNTSTGIYEVGFGDPDASTKEEMQQFAISFARRYANCISHDLTLADIESDFLPGSKILEMMQSGVTTNYFAKHSTPEIKDETIVRFEAYSRDVFLSEISLNQYMQVYAREEIVNTDLTYFFVRTEDGFKCCNIIY